MSPLTTGQDQAIADADALREKISCADTDTMSMILGAARTHHAWKDQSVSDGLLKQAYDLAKMGPTAMNIQPMRIVFLRGKARERRLIPLLSEGNRAKSSAAPVTAVLANDQAFYKNMDRIFPIMPGIGEMFENDKGLARENAERNGTLQAAYFIIALRSVGLDVAPMSGFDPAGVNNAFFAEGDVTVNFIVNIGYGDTRSMLPRFARYDFEEVAEFY